MRDIGTRFSIRNWSQSSDTGKKSDEGISDFWISGEALLKNIVLTPPEPVIILT